MALWARAKDLSSGETILSRGSVEAFNGDPGYKLVDFLLYFAFEICMYVHVYPACSL